MGEGREYISRSDELGNIHISEEVLAVIAAAAGLLSAVILRFCGKWIAPGYADVLRRRFSRSATSSQNQ